MGRTDATELDAIRRRAPIGGLFGEAEASATLDAATPEEGARTVSRRHDAAIESVEQSATPHETAIVERIQSMLRTRFRFTADDVATYLTEAGVPRTGPQAGNVRRRLASRIINGGKGKWWAVAGDTMTGDKVRSGRRIAIWQVIQFPDATP